MTRTAPLVIRGGDPRAVFHPGIWVCGSVRFRFYRGAETLLAGLRARLTECFGSLARRFLPERCQCYSK
jgi:hypothetical protein